ncbi:MAG: DUF3048 domain-containing protein [Enterocloster sp.]
MRAGHRWIVYVMAAAAAVFLGGCSSQVSVSPSSQAEIKTPETTTPVEIEIRSDEEKETAPESEVAEEYYLPEERVEADGKIRSYLTGQMVDADKGSRRPVAVMMSNDKEARPQYGINRAGVVYEAPAEGGMNRYMSILEDYDDLERIGSVRSCRTYYTYFAKEFDAIYAHYGQSTFAKPYLNNLDNINGLDAIGNVAFYRSSDKKSPHNAYTSGERLQKSIEQLGYSEEYASSYRGHYLFARDGREVDLSSRPGMLEAAEVRPGYQMNAPRFVYDEKDGLYHRYQYGGIHEGNEGPITAKNVIFQYCQSGYYATTEYLNINVHTSECGYFITGGKAIPISWEKDGEFGVTHYYDQDHREIVLNQGQTWVCIISTKDFARSEILGKDGV